MTDETESSEHPDFVSLVPSRLCAPAAIEWPSDLSPHLETASGWQRRGADSYFLELVGGRGRLYEIRGHMAGVGEQLGMACTCVREYVSWERLPSARPADEIAKHMSMRAISELTCYYALGIGHSLMNLTARTLALDNQLHVNLEKKFGTTFPPFSDEFRAWPALSKPKAEHLRQIAKTSRHGPFATLVDPIHTLASSEAWERLNEVRGEDFHRWRPQAVGMFTARKENPWTRSADGTFWTLEGSFGDRLGIDSADKTAKDTYLPARSVLDLQCSIMRDFDTQFEAACKAVFPAIRSLSL